MAPLRLALIGGGAPAGNRADAGPVRAGGRRGRRSRGGAGRGGVRASPYTSLRKLGEQERPDVAVVTVPADAHHAEVWFLAGQGVHVLVETPIAPTRALADIQIAAAERNRVALEVAENYLPGAGGGVLSAAVGVLFDPPTPTRAPARARSFRCRVGARVGAGAGG
jgi:predicted dehydrogenase